MCQYRPLLISKTFKSYVLFRESSISDPSILSANERRVIKKCLSEDLDFENEDEFKELLDVLKIYDSRARVNPENIEVIQEIAQKKLIQKPIMSQIAGKMFSLPLRLFSHSRLFGRYV